MISSKPHIVAFTGTVGSGKSTQVRLLARELNRKGIKAKVSFLKTGHLFAYLLEVILAKILVTWRKDVSPIRALIEEKPHIFKKIFRLWLGLDIISIVTKFLFSIYLPLKLGYMVLVEEYVPATISDYLWLSRMINFKLKPKSFAITLLIRLMDLGGFTHIVFLDANDDELRRRWRRRGSPYERGDYLNMQRTILLRISRVLSYNGVLYVRDQTIEMAHQLIKKHLSIGQYG